MNFDELIEDWRRQDSSTFYGVVRKDRLLRVLREEQVNLEKESRRGLWWGYALGVVPLLIASGLFLAMMTFQSNYRDVLIVWDYVVGAIGVSAAMTVAWTLFALRRCQRARDRQFDDSLRDHLRRRIARIDDEETCERRLGMIALAAGLICAVAIGLIQKRIAHVPVPWSEIIHWPLSFRFWPIVIFGALCLELFRWGPRRWRRKNQPLRHRLETLLQELDDE